MDIFGVDRLSFSINEQQTDNQAIQITTDRLKYGLKLLSSIIYTISLHRQILILNHMKKVFISVLFFLTLGFGASAKAEINERIEIPITSENENSHSKGPRMPERIPISCEYVDGYLSFTFNYDLGVVSVVVTNETTGEHWQNMLPTTGVAIMNVSEVLGNYKIEITTINNKVYCGDYEIN